MTDRRDAAGVLEKGRAAFAARAWARASDLLAQADAIAPLGTEDLERLASAACLAGRDEDCARARERAQLEYARRGDARAAARCTFWIVDDLLDSGDNARAAGWLTRAKRLLESEGRDCAERGLLLVLEARLYVRRGDLTAASEAAEQSAALADRFDDPDLRAFGRLILAQIRAREGDSASTAALLDELMVAVTVDEVSPMAVGTVYCAVIETCQAIFDLERARAWTAALSRWCGAQPELVRFRGHCLVHRAEVLRVGGAWSEAERDAQLACAGDDGVSASSSSWAGAAFYELAEILRMRGRFSEAEEAYRRAAQAGRSPEPGFALLRLAQGRPDAAAASVRRVLAESSSRGKRARVLAACAEIMIAVHDLRGARTSAEELGGLAATSDASYLDALSAQATGAVLLAEGRPREALPLLRRSWMAWQELKAPFDAARVRVLLALACEALGDRDAAQLELESALRVFERLDARPDVERVRELLRAAARPAASPLTNRELQVIRLVACGKPNREIARLLEISERTVDRHVANILRKLDLSSRSAATAYAYHHSLI